MYTEFVNKGVRYQLLTRALGRREQEQASEDIGPDPDLWQPSRKARCISGLASDEEIAERNKRAARKRTRAWRRAWAQRTGRS